MEFLSPLPHETSTYDLLYEQLGVCQKDLTPEQLLLHEKLVACQKDLSLAREELRLWNNQLYRQRERDKKTIKILIQQIRQLKYGTPGPTHKDFEVFNNP